MPNLKKQATEGAALVTLSYGISQIIRLGGNLVLTRLLTPELFGVMAIVQVFILGLGFFSDIGIGPSLIQNPRREESLFYNTAWTLQAIRGGLLWFGSMMIAYPVSRFYENDQLFYLIPIIGSIAVCDGFLSTARFILNQHLKIRRLIILDIFPQMVSLLVMIVWAYLDRTIWALVGGNIVAALLRTWISHHLLPGHINKFTWDRSTSRELFSFGRWIFLSTAAMYLASQADRIILGKLFTFNLLGVYAIALTMAEFPKQIISTLSGKIIFPLATYYAGKPRIEFRNTILQKRFPLLCALAFLIALMACTGDWIIQILYDERYNDAGIMLPILALGTWPLLLYSTHEPCLLALGKAHFKAIGNTALFVYLVIALPAAFHIAGVVGVMCAIFLKEIPTYLWVAWGSIKEGIYSLRQDCILSLLLFALVGAFTYLRCHFMDAPMVLAYVFAKGN